MKHLVDTNVLSELPKRAPDPAVLAWLETLDELVVSAITIDELTYGVERLAPEGRERLRRWLDGLLAAEPVVLPVDERIATIAGNLPAHQDRKGHPASQTDMLIAATALVEGRVLVTRNIRQFEGCGVAFLDPFGA